MRDILLLILFQTMWSSSYVAMKFALAEMPVGLIIILRYTSALVALICAGGLRGWKFSRRDIILIGAVGLLDFMLSPYLQLIALQLTYATDTAIMISFEPMLTTLLAVLILRERLEKQTIVVFVLATIGVLIMSEPEQLFAHAVTAVRFFGNSIFFLSLLCESLYSVTSRHATQNHNPSAVFTLMTLAAVLGNFGTHWPTLTWTHLTHIGVVGWSAVAFLGLGCSFIAYGGWTALTKRMPIKQITLSLYLQPLIGTGVAYIFLNEIPTQRTFIGGAIIVTTLFAWTWWKTHAHLTREACPPTEKVLAALPR